MPAGSDGMTRAHGRRQAIACLVGHDCARHGGVPATGWVTSTHRRAGRWLCAACIDVVLCHGGRPTRRWSLPR